MPLHPGGRTTMTEPSQELHPTPITGVESVTEQDWLGLFQPSPHHPHKQWREQSTSIRTEFAATLHNDMPPVGGDYDVVETQQWPQNVYPIPNNVFSVNRPYPVARRSPVNDACGCDGQCVGDSGSTLNSTCLNVATCCLCDPTNCSLGETCGIRFKTRYGLDLIQTRVGLGVVCCEPIPRGAFVIEYVGEVLLVDDADKRDNKQYQADLRTRAYWVGGMRVVIDAISSGNMSRYINHSCRPNCALFDCNWTNTSRLGIFALRDIPPLQELTFQYRKRNRLFPCQCGWLNCVSKQVTL